MARTISHQFLLRSATETQRRAERPQHHHLLDPGFAPKGLPLRHALTEGACSASICAVFTHAIQFGRSFHRPLTQRDTAGSADALPRTPLPPLLRSLDQSYTERITFDIPTHNEQMLVPLDHKRLEAPFVRDSPLVLTFAHHENGS